MRAGNFSLMRPRCFIDFDRTIFDTEYANAFFDDAIMIVGEERVRVVRSSLKNADFSLENFVTILGLSSEKIEEYKDSVRTHARIYPNVAEGLSTLSLTHDLILLSYGHQEYQMMKFESVSHLLPSFSEKHILQNAVTKGDIIASYLECRGDIFIDDLPENLLNVRQCAPWVKLFRPLYSTSTTATPHVHDDHYWKSFSSFEESIFENKNALDET